MLAQMFIDSLNEHGLKWKKQWHGVGVGSPYNGVTKARYRGCNQFFLHMVSMQRGYKDPRWVTMVQIMDQKNTYHPGEKWHLKKGTKAVYVEYWFPYDQKNKKALSWNEYKDCLANGRKEEEFTLSTRYTAVFNADEVEGMPKLVVRENREVKQEELIDTLSNNLGVPIYHDGGNDAYYRPTEDAIHVPEMGVFESTYAYNSTVLHELAHSTGHESRLNRSIRNMFGSENYSYEELIAEMTSCFMASEFLPEETVESEVHLSNHKAYIQSWISAIKDKPEMLVKALKEAQTAAAYMDYKAELITEQEYAQILSSTKFINTPEPKEKAKEEFLVPAKSTFRESIHGKIRKLKEDQSDGETEAFVREKTMH